MPITHAIRLSPLAPSSSLHRARDGSQQRKRAGETAMVTVEGSKGGQEETEEENRKRSVSPPLTRRFLFRLQRENAKREEK